MISEELRYKNQEPQSPLSGSKIIDNFYMCRVPALELRSLNDIRERGVILSGIKDLDEALKNEPIKVYLNIKRMSELFKNGTTIGLVKSGDSKEIYDIVQEHLSDWAEKIRTRRNMGDAPIPELINLDKFANAVYEHAKHYSNNSEPMSELEKYMTNMYGGVVNSNFFNSKENNQYALNNLHGNNSEDKVSEEIPARESFEERFIDSVSGLRRY